MMMEYIFGGLQMKIGIVGGGAMGQFLCTSLTNCGAHQVTLFTRTTEQAECIQQNGIVLLREGKQTIGFVRVKSIGEIEPVDVLIFTVKQYALEDALQAFRELEDSTTCTYVFLQNGMGHLKQIQDLFVDVIYVGTVSHGVTRVGMNKIIHKGVGPIRLSAFHGQNPSFEEALRGVNTNHFPVYFCEDWLGLLREKLYINAVINPLTALLCVKNGMLRENPYFSQMARQVFEELDEVFSFGETKEKIWQSVEAVMAATAGNESSMLQDVKKGRRTEIDGIYGYVINEAQKLEKPIRYIPFIYQAIRGMEEIGNA